MSKIEKTVFVSYRRTNSYHALAIFQALIAKNYEVFIDYEGIDSGKFDDIILDEIKARAHFIVILTPSALERCDDPNDWVRIEIMTAMQHERNIVPVMFDGFDWKNDIIAKLPDALRGLERYNALPVPSSLLYFPAAMELLHTKFLHKPVNVVLHLSASRDNDVVEQKIEVATSQPAVTQDQLSASEYFERGNQHLHLRNYDMAIADYTEAIRLNPRYIEAYGNRGYIYNDFKKTYDIAISDFNEVIRLNPQDARAYYNRGNVYGNKGDYDRAIADFDHAIRLNPQFAIAYGNRGNAYGNKGNYDRAIANFDRALQIDPHHEFARKNREIALRKKRGG